MRRPRRAEEWQEEERPGLMIASPHDHHHHDHGSDPDETDDESVLPRVRSFGDAEDYLNNYMNGGGNSSSIGYYESFVLQSPPPTSHLGGTSIPNGNLHHRSRQVASTPLNSHCGGGHSEDEDESPRHRLLRQIPSLNGAHHNSRYSNNNNNKRSWMSSSPTPKYALSVAQSTTHYNTLFSCWKSSYGLIRWMFLIGLGSYLVLLSKSTYYLGLHQDQQVSEKADGPVTLQMHYLQRQRQYQKFYFSSSISSNYNYYPAKWFLQHTSQVGDALHERQLKATDRRQRTRPEISTDATILSPTLEWHPMASLNDPRPYQGLQDQMAQETAAINEEDIQTATVDQLCGFQAQNASLSHPQLYPARAALNSKSRVLITGILSPIGVSLALHLQQNCGVQQIAGVDAMYPNTVEHRMLLQERIKLLTTNIPKLVKPLFLPYVGLDPKSKDSSASATNTEEEMNWMEGFEPTHIVHLASYSMEVLWNDALIDPEWKNTRSPYVTEELAGDSAAAAAANVADPFLYPMRSSMASLEQLLQSVASVPEEDRPQLIYAKQATPSSRTTANVSKKAKQRSQSSLFDALKRMDDIFIDAYHAHNEMQLPAIGLSLPNAIFGPWDNAGSVVHDMMERAVELQGDQNATMRSASIVPPYASPMSRLDMLYVDDAVDAIVSAMQYHTEQPISVSVAPLQSCSIVSAASTIQSYLDNPSGKPGKNGKENPFLEKLLTQDVGGIPERKASSVELKAKSLIVPPKTTPLKEGMLKSMAWHLDRQAPFGPPAVETGDDFLQRHGQETCAHDDVACHKSFEVLPCNSECNIHHQCLPSIFDPVVELMHNVSDGCDIVLYTQSLGYNVEDMDLHAEYMDDKDLDDEELLVCNFAFVPRGSNLVATVSDKVPNDQLAKFGIKPEASDASSKAMQERKLDGLNGRLLYRGWILIWVDDGLEPLETADRSILKQSPSRFFHPGVQYGLFVEENFAVSPNLEDVLFLVHEMRRRSLPDRTLKKEEKVQTPHGEVAKKVKYRIPKEPPRKAAILFAPLRYPNIDDPIIEQYRNGKRKLSIYDASKFMRHEVGYDDGEKESVSLRRQREYYERVPSYINKNTELRSSFEPWYRFSMRHWVRTRWVVHDFNLEDARLLRCDWYQEHIQWGNDLDQLSFANVAATRELQRRIAHQEPDDHIKSFIEEHPELHDLTDSYEWHALETDINKLHREPINWNSHVPPHVQIVIDPSGNREDPVVDEEMPLYIRIMSERVMAASRKIWTKVRKQILKEKKTGHKPTDQKATK